MYAEHIGNVVLPTWEEPSGALTAESYASLDEILRTQRRGFPSQFRRVFGEIVLFYHLYTEALISFCAIVRH
jgi:hypothetical protein